MSDMVSIIMPSYNTAKYISESIKSVQAQTHTNWELIIVDDCSTDNTDEIISEFLSDSRIRYIKNEQNSGAAVSRNRALREAKGKWIAFLDSDDLWLPDKLEKQIRFMQENGYKFTYTDYRIQLNGESAPGNAHSHQPGNVVVCIIRRQHDSRRSRESFIKDHTVRLRCVCRTADGINPVLDQPGRLDGAAIDDSRIG